MTGAESNDEVPAARSAEPGPADPTWQGPYPPDTIELTPTAGAARRPRTRLVAAIAAVTLVAVAAVALALATRGGSPQTASQRSPAQVLAAATRSSAAVRTFTATYSEQIGGATGSTIGGTIEEVRQPLTVSMSLSETSASQTVPFTALLTGDSFYILIVPTAGLPAALVGRWFEFPLASLAGGSFATLIHGFENETPVAMTQLVLAAKQLRANGTQVVAGVKTARYTGYFNPSAALKLLPASSQAALAPGLHAVSGNIYFSLWIDSKNQIRQLVEHENISSQPVTVTITYDTVNQPLTISVPPANRVFHIPASALNGTG